MMENMWVPEFYLFEIFRDKNIFKRVTALRRWWGSTGDVIRERSLSNDQKKKFSTPFIKKKKVLLDFGGSY